MTSSQGPEALRRLAEQSRTLLGELDHARPELLSIAELNRTLRQVLLNQATLLETLAAGTPGRPQIKVVRAKPAELTPLELADLDRSAKVDPETEAKEAAVVAQNGAPRAAAPKNGAPQAAPKAAAPKAAAPKAAAPKAAAPQATAPQAAATAGQPAATKTVETVAALLAETKKIPTHLCRGFVCDFDNRDRDYSKGLEKLNRWISAGSSGTPFQWRGDHAYLNLKGAGLTSARTYEEQIMARMGFSRRLGRLEVPGLDGDVVVYERPS